MAAEAYAVIRDRDVAAQLMAFAAGTRSDVPQYLVQHPQESVDFLEVHRVVGRLISVIDRRRDPSLDPVRRVAVESHGKHAVYFNFLQQKLAKFIKTYCHDMDVLLFKCHYYYSPGDLSIRPTGDIDIAVSRPTFLAERLAAAKLSNFHDRLPPHEVVNVVFEEAHIDLHRYYPAWEVSRYVTQVLDDGGACTLNSHRAHERGLSVAELIATGMEVNIDGSRFFVPSRTAAATITLAASHRDYLLHAAYFLKDHPPQRLSDLCEVRDALDDPSFSKSAFIELIRRQGLQDALLWMAGNTEAVLGDTRLLALHQEAFGDAGSSAIGADWMLRVAAGGFWLPFSRDAVRDLTILIPTSEVTDGLKVPEMALADGERKIFALGDPAVQKQIGIVLSGHILLDGHVLEISRQGLTLSLAYKAGAEIHKDYRAFFEINGETMEWDNLYSPDVEPISGSPAAYKGMLGSVYDRETRTMKLQFRLSEAQRDEELNVVFAASAPAVPWESERGSLLALRIRLT